LNIMVIRASTQDSITVVYRSKKISYF